MDNASDLNLADMAQVKMCVNKGALLNHTLTNLLGCRLSLCYSCR